MENNKISQVHLIEDFSSWTTLNDSIMGGSSYSECKNTENGLFLKGNLIEEGGGFISCRSEYFKPALNYSNCTGLQLCIEGEGRNLKIAISCQDYFLGLTGLISDNIKWIMEFPTKQNGITVVEIPFDKIKPSIRAKPVIISTPFNSSAVNRIQLLYSKFGNPGEPNRNFRSGPFKILLRSISGLSK